MQEGGIASIQGVAGYLAVGTGPKVVMYQYEDRANMLRAVAEYEGKIFTTCIAPMRSFMICGDYLRGLAFIRFKEEEKDDSRKRSLEVLAEDNSHSCVTATEFWIDESHPEQHFLGLLSADAKGFLQIFAYFLDSMMSLL